MLLLTIINCLFVLNALITVRGAQLRLFINETLQWLINGTVFFYVKNDAVCLCCQ